LYFENDTVNYKCSIENFDDYTGIYVNFGDDRTSKKLSINDRVRIIYAETTGEDGNIESVNIITREVTPIIDSKGNELVDIIFVTNQQGITGGSDIPSIEHIKKVSGALYNSGYQLNNRASWEASIQDLSYIYKAKVWTELDLSDGVISLSASPNQNIHYVTAITTSGNALTVGEETSISQNILIPRKGPTDIISWQKLKKIGIRFVVDATITSDLSLPDTISKISTSISNEYDVLQLDFGEEIYQSNYIRVIDAIDNVIRHSTIAYYVDQDVPMQEVLLTFQVSKIAAVESDTSKQILVTNSTPEIWIRRKISDIWHDAIQIASSSGITVSGENTFNVSGNVDYTNCQISYQCFDIISDIVPSFALSGTTTNSSNVVVMASVAGIEIGMYASGINIQADSIVTAIDGLNISLNQPVASSGAGVGSVTFSWYPDAGGSFGIRNPSESETTGYILFLVYRNEDGDGRRKDDLRISNFDQIFDYLPELSDFNLTYN
jgi:hypothetical protein